MAIPIISKRELDNLRSEEAASKDFDTMVAIDQMIWECTQEAYRRWNAGEWMRDSATMQKVLADIDANGGVNKTWGKNKFRLVYAMPLHVHDKLRNAQPDGMKNFDDNIDFMKFLQNRGSEHEWLKKFPLATEPKEKG